MSKKINELGNHYGALEVIAPAASIRQKAAWLCRCECGREKVYTGDMLRRGEAVSCAECSIKKDRMKMVGKENAKDITGVRAGKLVAIERAGTAPYGGALWLCKCDCGNSHIVELSNFLNKNTLSCGCLVSQGEFKIQQILEQKQIKFKTQFYGPNWYLSSGYHPHYDFAVFKEEKLLFLLEFHGLQHEHYHSNTKSWNNKENFEQTQRRDREKILIAKENKIPLYTIWYKDNLEEKLEEILRKENLI